MTSHRHYAVAETKVSLVHQKTIRRKWYACQAFFILHQALPCLFVRSRFLVQSDIATNAIVQSSTGNPSVASSLSKTAEYICDLGFEPSEQVQ